MMSRKRQESTDKLNKDTCKLIMNAPYGKFLQNKENYTETHTYTDEEEWLRATWRMNVSKGDYTIVQGGVDKSGKSFPFLGTVTTTPSKGVVLDTPRLQGFAILEISKLMMLRLHYTVFKPFYGSRALLGYTDTDSLIYLLQTDDFLDDFEQINRQSIRQIFDLKDTGRVAPNAGQLGLAKVESEDKTIVEMALLAPKMYSYILADADLNISTEMKAKGVPTKILKKMQKHADYMNVVTRPLVHRDVEFRAMRSSHHQVEHRLIKKRGLMADNDKVYILARGLLPQVGSGANTCLLYTSPSPRDS